MGSLEQFDGAPGADLVAAGLDDLARGRETAEALLVCMARTRLRSVGVEVPAVAVDHPSHRLYDLLAEDDPLTAHGRFNALVRRLASFARAAEHARAR
ncbi:MAG TPA: hypothetical protein VHF89_06625 [Solirubrobacteraceae bacterium]|nr:hypothetical protein [Solirubrobacteraceae bacterium]